MPLDFLYSKPKLYFATLYASLFVGSYFAPPLAAAIVMVHIIKTRFKLLNRLTLYLLASLIVGFGGFITVLYWMVLMNQWGLIAFEINFFPATIFWIVEAFHFTIMVIFIISLVRVIRFPFTPYAAIYASLYNGVHVVYSGCPVSELQNYLSLQTTTITPIDNIFWRGIFGTDPLVLNLLRVVFGLFSLALLYLGYKQITKIPTDKWTTAWVEKDFAKYYIKTAK